MKRGFTLIEMMVAVAIFAIVMMVGVGALLSLTAANRRAQAINSVMQNLNAALENMSRSIRVGTTYHCESTSPLSSPFTPPPTPPAGTLATTQDCSAGGGWLLAVEPSGGDRTNANDQLVYRLNGTALERSLDSGATWVAMTAPEVSIDSFQFYVVGSTRKASGDTVQPRVLISIKGSAAYPGGKTSFSVQASVVQRLIDI